MKFNTGQFIADANNAKAAGHANSFSTKGQPAGPADIAVAEGSANGDKGGCTA